MSSTSMSPTSAPLQTTTDVAEAISEGYDGIAKEAARLLQPG